MKMTVSIIIPVFNVENYIKRCLDSVISQTFKELEIIIIDDGGTDKSGEICDQYAMIDSRISVIHQENRGLSNARNVGIKRATGDYLYFLDSDDWIETDCIEKLVDTIQGYDIAWCSNVIDYGEKITNIPINQEIKYDIAENFEDLMKYLIGYYEIRNNTWMQVYVWNKLYRRNIIDRYNIEFNEKAICSEDILFNYEYLCKCNNGGRAISSALYHYVMQDSSIMHKYKNGFSPQYCIMPIVYENMCFDLAKRLNNKELLLFWQGRTAYFYHSVLWKMENALYEDADFVIKARKNIGKNWMYFWRDPLISVKIKMSCLICKCCYPIWKRIIRKI